MQFVCESSYISYKRQQSLPIVPPAEQVRVPVARRPVEDLRGSAAGPH